MTQDDWCVLFLKVLEDDNTSEEVFEDRMVQLTAILLLLALSASVCAHTAWWSS